MPETSTRLVSPSELAAYLGVSRAHVYNLIHRGMPTVLVGACRRFRIESVNEWLTHQQEAA